MNITPGKFWYVQPLGALNSERLEKLSHEVRVHDIPGLDLSDHWEIRDSQMKNLRTRNLRMLVVSRTRIGDAGLRSVGTLKNLETLAVSENTTDDGLASLHSLKRLQDLNLDRAHVTDKAMQTLLHFERLERLDLSSTQVSAEGVALLARLPKLSYLVVNGSLTDATAGSLASLKALEELDLSQTTIDGAGYAALASLPRLRTLYVSRSLTDMGLESIGKIKTLRSLDLSGTHIKDTALTKLTDLPDLRELALTDTSVTDDGIAHLSKMRQLRILELSGTRVTSAGLARLAKVKTLDTVSVSWEKLNRKDVQNLSRLVQVKTLLLNGAPLPETVMTHLKELARMPLMDYSPAALDKELSAPAARGKPLPPPEIARVPLRALPTKITQAESVAPSKTPSIRGGSGLKTAATPPVVASKAPSVSPAKSMEVAMQPRMPAPEEVRLSTSNPQMSPKLRDQSARASAPLQAPAIKTAELPLEQPASRGATAAAMQKDLRRVSLSPPVPSKEYSEREDNILQAIQLHSKSAGHSPIPSLSTLRLYHSGKAAGETLDVTAGSPQNITVQEDRPQDFIGDINVNATRAK